MSRIFKITYSSGDIGHTGSQVQLIEDFDAFSDRLCKLAIEAEAKIAPKLPHNDHERYIVDSRWRRVKHWYEHVLLNHPLDKGLDDSPSYAKSRPQAYELIDGAWLPVEYDLVAPHLTFFKEA